MDGIFVPGLPMPVCVLVSTDAAWVWARLRCRLGERLLFGPLIRDWQAHDALSRQVKWVTAWVMLAATTA